MPEPVRPSRSRDWFADPHRSYMVALCLERFMNYGLTAEELRAGRPIIGIAQTGSSRSPCRRTHLQLAERVREGFCHSPWEELYREKTANSRKVACWNLL